VVSFYHDFRTAPAAGRVPIQTLPHVCPAIVGQ